MLTAAFILGFTGSLHCVGMCGPIAMLIRGGNKNQYLFNRLLYHAGRTITYILLGIIVGAFGSIFKLSGWQAYLSLGSGVVILILLIFPLTKSHLVVSSVILKLKSLLGKFVHSKNYYSNLLLGIFNGFLPCGLVYSALLLALVQSTIEQSILVMTIFGLATIPALFIFSSSAKILQSILPISINSLQRIALFLVGVLMIWRGFAFAFPEIVPGSEVLCHS